MAGRAYVPVGENKDEKKVIEVGIAMEESKYDRIERETESGTLAEPIVKQCKAYVYKKYVKTKSFLGKLLQMKGVFGIFFLMYYSKS